MYQRTQTGRVIIWTLSAGLLFCLWCLARCSAGSADTVVLVTVSAIIGVCLLLFSSMSVSVDDRALSFWFSCGWPKKTIPLEEITSCSVVVVPWWWGYGIRITPRGWMYRVAGNRCVQVSLASGRTFLLGADEPEALCREVEIRKKEV